MNVSRTILALSLALIGTHATAADPYFRFPAVRGDTTVFTAEGDLWRTAAHAQLWKFDLGVMREAAPRAGRTSIARRPHTRGLDSPRVITIRASANQIEARPAHTPGHS